MKVRELQKALEEFIFVGQSHKIGIFSGLYDKPDTADGLALRMGFDKRAAFILLEALVEMGYLKKQNGKYTVPAQVFKRLVDSSGKDYEGDFWQFLIYLMNPWKTLPYVLKYGKPDKSSYKDFNMDDFIRGMDSPWKKQIAGEIAELCLGFHKGAKTAADIGGAPGTIAREFARRGIKTVIFDLPESMRVMGKELSKIPNIKISEGDATKALPEDTFDIAFLGNLCHGQSPEDNLHIITMCYELLNPGGIIVVFDNLRGENPGSAALALHMLTQSPLGDIYTREKYFEWLKAAGFKGLRVKRLSDPAWSLVLAFKRK
jgi:SAM-dependent methyltransferase